MARAKDSESGKGRDRDVWEDRVELEASLFRGARTEAYAVSGRGCGVCCNGAGVDAAIGVLTPSPAGLSGSR